MKHAKFNPLFSLAVLFAASLCLVATAGAQFRDSEEETKFYDYQRAVKYSVEEKEVGSPEEVTRTPLFDNFPFLRLKPGDKIIKGHPWREMGKGMKPGYSEGIDYFLLSEGRYFSLSTHTVEEKFKLSQAWYSLLFDWQFNLQSATQLYEAFQYQIGSPIDIRAFPKLKAALKEEFPASLLDVEKVEVAAPHVVEKENVQRAVFQSVRFDWLRDIVYLYQVEIGNGIFTRTRKPLLVGPRHVERREFEGDNGSGGINGTFPHHPDVVTAARRRDEFERMEKFQAIVNKFLVKPRTNQSGFQ